MCLSCGISLLFQKGFGIIKQLLPLSEGDMTICSPEAGYILFPDCVLKIPKYQSILTKTMIVDFNASKQLKRVEDFKTVKSETFQ